MAIELVLTSLFNDANLVSYWRLQGNSTDSKGSNNGSDTNITYSDGNGKFGQGAGFNGSSSVIDVTDSASLSLTGHMTIIAWVKPTVNNANMGIVEKFDGAGTDGYFLRMNNSGVLLGWPVGPAGGTSVTGNTVLTTNTYHQVAMVYDGAKNYLYLDGLLDNSVVSTTDPTNGTHNLEIGSSSGVAGGNFFNGAIDDVAIFSRNLTAAEVAFLFNAGQGFIGKFF